ncbi:hypothetical protein SAMN05444679_1162 [Variovorax sp. CF079]|uniref:DUF6502 family protein n=1 Tax=Variovorax sp. CF079 TaxID=1882774 RepID=UPI00088764A4|nr:hypothetical protein SAMN05444679_1162 [Variovorax sp. CF079]
MPSDKAQITEGQLAWVLAACARVMRPLVRLALAFGVKHPHLEELLRDLLIDEARRAWLQNKGAEPNISQLSVTTGLNRKAVTTKVREPEDPLPHTEMSAAAKTLTLWLQMIDDDPAHRSLPIVAEAQASSFETVARRASHGNVHHRAILDELVRLNMAIEHEGRAELNATAFVPAKDLKTMLAFLGDNTRDHLLAGVANTLGAEPPLLERSVFAAGIALEDCERIHELVRERWSQLHHELTREMTRAFEEAEKTASGRIRVGIYTYYEDGAAERAEAPAATPSKRLRGRKA